MQFRIFGSEWEPIAEIFRRFMGIVRMLRMILEMVCPGVIFKRRVVMEPKELDLFGTEQEPECHMLYGVSSMVNLWQHWLQETQEC